ncbi:hypothetical protein HFC70_24020 [Agrobacterium sp. a22-2]|uniref:hypothetical protein n=1 Tax=Agrobacterium sp. a22-2 TaxID=2283840 RepID=UPI00144899B0|nr:hypothetical protein [Agrobacterium sp. a22-2]NKN39417.1 hypothetical protein [Agrobacterium sp. a22-2]
MDKAADPTIWEILFFIVNCAVILVMTLGFIAFAGGNFWLFNVSIFRALFAGRSGATMGEDAAVRLEAGASVLTDDVHAKTRRRVWRGLAIFLMGFLYFVIVTIVSVLLEQ